MKAYTVVNSQYANKPIFVQNNAKLGWNITAIDVGTDWHMWKKPMWLRARLSKDKVADDDLIMYCDALDVTLRATPERVEQLYCKHFEGKVVFNAEVNPTVWTDKPKLEYAEHTIGKGFPFINAGVFIGRAKQLQRVLTSWCKAFWEAKPFVNAGNSGCDQAPLIMAWSADKHLPICVDTRAYIMLATRGIKDIRNFEGLAIQHDN